MNTKNLKAYAPKARSQFIEAIKKRAAQFGLYQDKIVEMQSEGSSFIIEGRAFTKKQGQQRQQLEHKINSRSEATHTERYSLFIREMAYTWFNRLAAIRYMELHDYLEHGFRVLSHPNSQDQLPEILDNASDVADTLALDKNHIIELQLAGNKEEELYRELLLGQCHYLYKVMPFMFEAIDDATELLLPDNLTKTDSILKGLVNKIPEQDWSKIEVIGWLYQFYISEHKDAVIGKVVKSEDIPAATQLFTPNWIVKYLVQNSLGRQWLATYPESDLKGKMEYYIEPAEQSAEVIEQLKAITPTSIDPEQIKVLDPAAGSGHILVEVYEVLREIYLERGYRLREIPELILTKNIYGLDIDDRAAQLAGFALMMKAREDDRRIFQRVERGEVALNVYSLQSTEGLDIGKLWQALNLEGNQQQGSTNGLFDELGDEADGFVQPTGVYKEYFELLQTLKSAFLQAKTLGSLIQVDNKHLQNLVALKALLQAKGKGTDHSSKKAATDLLLIVNQAISLAHRYHALIANPPYMGNKGMNAELKEFAKKYYPNSKSDLFAIFMERAFGLLTDNGYNAQVNMQSWMFLSSYEKMRKLLLESNTFITMAHLGARAFSQISGEVVQTTAWVLKKSHVNSYQPVFFRLIDGNEDKKREALLNKENRFDQTQQDEFKKIPGNPIAYWISEELRGTFSKYPPFSKFAYAKQGLATADNNRFLRLWHEINVEDFELNCSSNEKTLEVEAKWFPHSKGGGYRRWYGNNEWVINWKNNGSELRGFSKCVIRNPDDYFKGGITWCDLTSSYFNARNVSNGFVFDTTGPTAIMLDEHQKIALHALMNSSIFQALVNVSLQGLHYSNGIISKMPVNPLIFNNEKLISNTIQLEQFSKEDWNQFETSWEFKRNPLIFDKKTTVKATHQEMLKKHDGYVALSQKLEEENNSIISSEYGVESCVNNSVQLRQITLNINPLYRYKNSDGELQLRLQSETLTELLSFGLGCMMGRYSLDQEGLVYANSGNKGFKELVAEGAYKSFPADDDGIVPLASEDWLFGGDATARFREFVKTVWGEAHLQENLEFVAQSLCLHALKPLSGSKGQGESANDTVRRYFSKQFYKDHCKTYKKRPIYWLFSSGKEKAFECLVYLHRYNEGTLARMRTEYVTPLMGKYDQQQSMLSEQIIEASNTEKRSIEKDLKSLEKKQVELRTFDEQLKHYAEMRITLDLDDGVKANYGKFGNLLADVKAIHGKLPEKIK